MLGQWQHVTRLLRFCFSGCHSVTGLVRYGLAARHMRHALRMRVFLGECEGASSGRRRSRRCGPALSDIRHGGLGLAMVSRSLVEPGL